MDNDKSVEKMLEDLLSKMTLEEKIGQLKSRGVLPWRIFFAITSYLKDAL